MADYIKNCTNTCLCPPLAHSTCVATCIWDIDLNLCLFKTNGCTCTCDPGYTWNGVACIPPPSAHMIIGDGLGYFIKLCIERAFFNIKYSLERALVNLGIKKGRCGCNKKRFVRVSALIAMKYRILRLF